MKLRTNVWICRSIVFGVVDIEKDQEANSSELQYIHILYKRLGPYLKKIGTRFRVTVSVQEMIAMSLHKLGSGDEIQTIGDLYGVH